MDINEIKADLIKGVMLARAESIELSADSAIQKLPMDVVVGICETWPTHYEEHCEVLAGTDIIESGARSLACDIILNEATSPAKIES